MKANRILICSGRVALALSVIGLAFAAGKALAQSDDFNDGNDNGWTRYDPISAVAGPRATYSFPNGAYRIRTAASPLPSQLGPARAGSLREDVVYTNFFVSVDLVDWDETVNQAFGIIARVKEPGLGSTDGYAMTFDFGGNDIDITWFTNEDPNRPNGGGVGTGPDHVTMVHGRVYRFQFIGRDSALKARVYELPNTTTPVAEIAGTDTHWVSGFSGLLIYDNSSTANGIADATFDNYVALDVEPPRLNIQLLTFGDYVVTWPAEFSEFVLESTDNLASPNWTAVTGTIQNDGTYYYYYGNIQDGPQNYFRLVRPRSP